MTKVADVTEWMESIAPNRLSADWDNTGLLLGDHAAQVERVMTCLTLTQESVQEAIEQRANLVLSHHPLPFRPIKSITTADTTGKLLWQLASSGISVYCPHTAWDSAHQGINSQIARHLGLLDVQPIVAAKIDTTFVQGRQLQKTGMPIPTQCVSEGQDAGTDSSIGSEGQLGVGRVGDLAEPVSIDKLALQLSKSIPHCRPRGVDCGQPITRIAIVCGSGGSMLSALLPRRCDLFLTGEATFHQCLEAQAAGISMLMIGHFASEKFAMDHLATLVSERFPELHVWSSLKEKDPVRSIAI